MVSGAGSVCDRGVEGRCDDMLSSEVLLSWRASVFASPMLSLCSGRVPVWAPVRFVGRREGALETVEWDRCWPSSSVSPSSSSVCGDDVLDKGRTVAPGAERAVECSAMASRRWRSSSCCGSPCAAGEDEKCAAVMAASCEKA